MLFDFLKKECPSNRGHKIVHKVITNKFGDKYCCDEQCLIANIEECIQKEKNTYVTIGVGSGNGNNFVHGDYESVKILQFKLIELEKLRRDNNSIQQHYNNYKIGNTMSDQTVVDVMLEAHAHLVGSVAALGVIEQRIPGFIDWYERVRDERVGAQSDNQTYKLSKTIIKLQEQIIILRSKE